MSFSKKLKELRIKNNLTQTDLGEKIYLSRATISKYEQGKMEPNIDTIIELSNIFKVSIDELLR
ncbi:helix-turn-helix domain-containing protein [uncultured Ruminococcus sp.]|uniref:helix-turn-helix domain-containing protein n=1 Tax=uncultured Ruminococcus sp. TaxID=165186 RepID=UPI00265CC378|nr:helix-turn-helix transcriptional regulator [uncultured Ruminococcus sp.]